MAPAVTDDPELASCKAKLKKFRIKELKDVLQQLGLPKLGKKQDLLDRLTSILGDQQNQEINGISNKSIIGRETLVKIVDDTFRKMQDPTNTVAAPTSHINSGHGAKSKKKPDVSPMLSAVCCPCGNSMPNDSMIQCVDPQCNVWQHVSCVTVPEKPADNSAPELPSSFYCEMCRISRADPFWVTINSPLLPILTAPSIIEADGSYTAQYIAKSFALSAANREMLQKAEYDLQVWCILLNDQVPFRIHWPLHSNFEVNGFPVRVVNRQPTQKLGANGRDDGLVITEYLRDGSNKIALSSNDSRTFCLGIRIVQKRTMEQVLSLVPKEQDGEKFDDALARVRRCVGGGAEANNGDSDTDIEVVADSVSVNVRCPMTASRIRVAGRFKPCAHMGCFDLEAFIEMNQRSRKWQYPICLKNYSLENIIIDPYFNRITSLMQSCGNETTEIDVKPDGSWKVKGGPALKDLAKWHLPDGTLYIATDSGGKSNTDIIKHEIKEEPLSEELGCRLKLGIRKNSNGKWQIRKKGSVPSSDGNSTRHLGNKSCTEDGSCTMSHVEDLESSPSGENAPPAPREQDVVVLSDSDDNDAVTVSYPEPLRVGREQPGGGPNETTYLAPKEGFDDLGLSFWDFPSPQDVVNCQPANLPIMSWAMFDSGIQVTDHLDGVENHLANGQSKHEPVSLGDPGAMAVAANSVENVHDDGLLQTCTSSKRDGGSGPANTQTCHDVHSDNFDESLVTLKTMSKKRRRSKGGITALDASVVGNTTHNDLLCPSRPPEKQRSVRPTLVTIDSDTD